MHHETKNLIASLPCPECASQAYLFSFFFFSCPIPFIHGHGSPFSCYLITRFHSQALHYSIHHAKKASCIQPNPTSLTSLYLPTNHSNPNPNSQSSFQPTNPRHSFFSQRHKSRQSKRESKRHLERDILLQRPLNIHPFKIPLYPLIRNDMYSL